MNSKGNALPAGWVRATLGDIGEYLNGRAFKKEEWASTGRPIIRIQDLTGSRNTPNYFTGSVEGRYEVHPGDLLISWAATLGAYIWRGAEAVLNQHIFKVTSYIDHQFHYHLATFVIGDLYRQAHGSGMVHITKGTFERTPIAVPPLQEQQRIAAEIDAQLSRIDSGVTALKRTAANLNRYLASVLTAACEGRLVPAEAELARRGGREYEPGAALLPILEAELQAIGDELPLHRRRYRSGNSLDPIHPAFITHAEPIPAVRSAVPEGWTRVSVARLGLVESGQTPKGIDHVVASEGEVPWVKVGDMNGGGGIKIGESRTYISRNQAARLGLHVRPAGTIIFPKRGGAIATNKKRILAVPAAYDLNTMGIVPAPSVARYFWWWFAGVNLSLLGDGSNIPQINHDDVAELLVPLPPLAEQERIVAEIERRLSTLDRMEAEVERGLRRAERLRHSILKRAFEGKLVPQDPSDEPASALLERIRAARTTQLPRKRRAAAK